jgi:hypothetical protein
VGSHRRQEKEVRGIPFTTGDCGEEHKQHRGESWFAHTVTQSGELMLWDKPALMSIIMPILPISFLDKHLFMTYNSLQALYKSIVLDLTFNTVVLIFI